MGEARFGLVDAHRGNLRHVVKLDQVATARKSGLLGDAPSSRKAKEDHHGTVQTHDALYPTFVAPPNDRQGRGRYCWLRSSNPG
jgi:hypothetical protein